MRGADLTFKANRAEGRHGWLRLTPAYSVHLVRDLAADLTPADRVLDPFCGTGTTALVLAERGIPCDTLDINPFLVWFANAKCAAYTPDEIALARETITRALTLPPDPAAWTPPLRDIEKWWPKPTLDRLAAIFAALSSTELPTPARDLCRIVFCRAAIALSTASFRHQSMSFQKVAAPSSPELIDAAFRDALDRVLPAAADPIPPDLGRALPGDARDLAAALPRRDYTAVITSPPYPNRMSYIRELRPYMYWLGYLESGQQAGKLDWQAIGGTWGSATSNLLRWTPEVEGPPLPLSLQSALDAVGERSAVLGRYIAKYIHDIDTHLAGLRVVLAPLARVTYIVGNSRFYETLLPTEELYAHLLGRHSFGDVAVKTLRKRTSKRELFEFAVLAQT